jgi:hypothetical protein
VSPRLPRRKPKNHGSSGTVLVLLAGLTLLATPPAANAFNFTVPPVDAPASEDCCDTDEGHTFRGYTAELWDEAPTISPLDCPDQDDACLLNEVDQISRLTRLQAALVSRAAFERARHFGEGPLGAKGFAVQ